MLRFPDMPYFRDANVQSELTNVLYLYSTSNPTIGYRQGMHELLAAIYLVVDHDSLSDSGTLPPLLAETCSRTWVTADSWLLFHQIMKFASKWYEWQEPVLANSSNVSAQSRNAITRGPLALKVYVAPISDICTRVQGHYLKSVDPALWRAMQDAEIEPQMYGM